MVTATLTAMNPLTMPSGQLNTWQPRLVRRLSAARAWSKGPAHLGCPPGRAVQAFLDRCKQRFPAFALGVTRR